MQVIVGVKREMHHYEPWPRRGNDKKDAQPVSLQICDIRA